MTNKENIYNRFDDAIDRLYETNHYLAAEITKLGYPEMTNNLIPTAGVMWNKERKKICFLFNENFYNKISDKEFRFIVAHEASHVFYGHIFLLHKEIEKLTRINKTKSKILNFSKKFNIAADCVVNDSLINLYGFEKIMNNEAIYGEKMINMHCHDLTAMDVYYLLPDIEHELENHFWESFFNDDGSINKDFVDSMKSFIEKNIENSEISDEEMKQVDKLKEIMKNSLDVATSIAGNTTKGIDRIIKEYGNDTLKWNNILTLMVETSKTEDVWNKTNRKLAAFYPDIILPYCKNKEKQKIFVAIDSSGSIDYEALRLFVSVLKNSPNTIDIEAISFDTSCYEYNINDNTRPKGGGGTKFDIIENYIQKNCKKYPKAVFVLTDGHGSSVFPQHPSRWCWLLYGEYSTIYCQSMKYFDIKKMLK